MADQVQTDTRHGNRLEAEFLGVERVKQVEPWLVDLAFEPARKYRWLRPGRRNVKGWPGHRRDVSETRDALSPSSSAEGQDEARIGPAGDGWREVMRRSAEGSFSTG